MSIDKIPTLPLSTQPIGVFDSGIGGLTVVKAIQSILPNENLIYFGDIARLPYGTKSAVAINKFARECVLFLLEQRVKAIIIACNTISAIAGEIVQELSKHIPVINIIHSGAYIATQQAINHSSIGVIATPATIKAGAYSKIINQINPKINVYSQACPLLVPFIEAGYRDALALELITLEYLESLLINDINSLILGCTHYPIITPLINKCLLKLCTSHTIDIINPAWQASEDLSRQLIARELLNISGVKPQYKFFVTDTPDSFKNFAQQILGIPIENVQLVNLATSS